MNSSVLPRVGVVGAGRVGAVFAAKLAAAGLPVVAVCGRCNASRPRIETRLGEVAVRPLDAVARACDLLVLAIPDDVLQEVVEDFAEYLRPGQIVVHTSGRHGTAVLAAAAQVGARTIAAHPAMTFT